MNTQELKEATKEIKCLKSKLEKDIDNLIKEFFDKTGVSVIDIEYDFTYCKIITTINAFNDINSLARFNGFERKRFQEKNKTT